MLCTVMMAVFLLFSGVSCKKDTEFSETVLLPEEEVIIDVENTIVIPENFDWSNIPVDYKDAVWDIQFDFDLNAATIVLPKGVTLYFTGGSLTNGTVMGDGTSAIVSKTKYQIFEGIDLAGTFVEEQYLMPYWFGAVMNGITDDRDVFVETLAQAHAVTARVMVDKNMFLDVEETGTKAIFIQDNTWIEGNGDIKITVNNLYSPVFHMALSENVTYKNFTIEWNQKYDAANMRPEILVGINQQVTEKWLAENKSITFSYTNPISNSVLSYQSIFLLDGAQNINLENITIKAVDDVTADRFIPMGIKFKSQFDANQVIQNESAATRKMVSKIRMTNVIFDGTLMAIQGTVDDFITDGMKSYRYSDAQTANGSNIGAFDGTGYNFPPPHLMYINANQFDDNSSNIQILNTIDFGEYVGTYDTRPTLSGYCNSLKLTDQPNNVVVKNYKSFRRDGLADLGSITNGVFENLYSESNSSIFNPDFKFKVIRFLGILENCVFSDIVIKDQAEIAEIYPFNAIEGNNVKMDNVELYLKELNTSEDGFWGFFGSYNTITNSFLNIEKHSSTDPYKSILLHDSETMKTCKDNSYNITVNGWRSLNDDPSGICIRLPFTTAENQNSNYAKIIDTNNNFVIEQEDNIRKDIWTRNEVINLGSGNKHELEINIPAGFVVESAIAETLDNLEEGIEVSIGTSNSLKNNLISTISKTTGIVTKFVNEIIPETGDREVYLYSNADFNNRGKVEITLKLVRGSQY